MKFSNQKIQMNSFEKRRNRLLEIAKDGVIIIPANHAITRNNDVEYEFRQNSSFWYLSGFEEPDAVMVLDTNSNKPYTMFVNPADPQMAIWVGERVGIDKIVTDFRANFGISINNLKEELSKITSNHQCIYYALGSDNVLDPIIQDIVTQRSIAFNKTGINPICLKDPNPLINQMRMIKSKEEIDMISQGITITTEGFKRAMEETRIGKKEFEIQAILEYEFRKNGSQRNGYPSIVATGENACTLHYTKNNSTLKDNDLLLIDAGAEFDYYTADITRTWPANGHFSSFQKEIYQIVLEAQKNSINIIKPGIPLTLVHETALKILVEGLIDLKLLDGSRDYIIENRQYLDYFMHGTSHWLGIDVHDVGNYKQQGENTILTPGMVFTVEPGIYIGQQISSGAAEKYKNIGIRIEDDLLVTESGHEIISKKIPKEITEIEEIINH